MLNLTNVKCVVCGKFMSYSEMITGIHKYTPDSEFTSESIEFIHQMCVYKKPEDKNE